MQYVKGKLLHRKQFKTKRNKEILVISILDENEKFSQVLDITDFDNYTNGTELGSKIWVPVKVKAVVSQKGNLYLNYVTAGSVMPVETA
jgi:hypothetical protein